MHDTSSLPTEGFVRLPQILSVIPVSRTSWWRGIKAGQFPEPIKLGRSVMWKVHEIRELIDRLAEGQDG